MKIAIDLGHGVGGDRGAMGFIAEEEIINTVGELVIEKLKIDGHTVITTRPTNTSSVSESINARCNTANNNNVDFFCCIHANAGGGKGSEVWTYNGNKMEEASRFLQKMQEIGFINRGIKDGTNFGVVHGTNAPCMLLELCFVDTKTDVELYRKNIDNIANAIVYGVTGNITITPNKPATISPLILEMPSTPVIPTVPATTDFEINIYANFEHMGDRNINGFNDVILDCGNGAKIQAICINIQNIEYSYIVHQSYIGDVVGYKSQIIGTKWKENSRIEGIQINVKTIPPGYVLQYRTLVDGLGWTNFSKNEQFSGTRGQSRAITAIHVKIEKEVI